MALSPWLTLRQAAEAVANNRPDEAHRLIEPLVAEGYRKAWKLAREVVKAYAARAKRYLDQDNPDVAWRELLAAEALNTGEKVVAELRLTLTRLGLVQTRAALEAGDPVEAVAVAARLRERGVRHTELTRLEEAAQDWILASELADKGDFLRALAELDKVRPKLTCPLTGFDRYRADVEARHDRFRTAVAKLYDAAEAKHWREALNAAEEVLAAAPEHREARTLKTKAWHAAHPETGEYIPAMDSGVADAAVSPVDLFAMTRIGQGGRGGEGERGREDTPRAPAVPRGLFASSGSAAPVPPLSHSSGPYSGTTTPNLPKRFLLWVDGVGGYLVCLAPRVTFGQATLDGPVDVPLYADVSRLHAEISRDGEGYVIESGKAVLVNGKEATRTVLAAGDRVTLGSTCQFLFHKPVSVSSTARLELTSGHRLTLAVEGVLLMGNELMLGPGPNAHVVIPKMGSPVLLYRSKEGLGVRYAEGTFRVDDRPYTDRAPLPLPAVVTAEAFTFAVEPVGPRL